MEKDRSVVPEWQRVIRSAQQQVREENEADARRCEAEELSVEQGKAAHLQRALAFFGIDAKPTINEYVLDGYRFSLASLSTYDPTDVFRESDRGVFFKLFVSAVYPEEYENPYAYDEPRYHTYRVIECAHVTDWQDKQAELANVLDSTKAEAERLVNDADARRKYLAEHPEHALSQPTVADRLVGLIREIIHDETHIDAY